MAVVELKRKYFKNGRASVSGLNKFKKACFQPHKSNQQLIKFECEQCSKESRYNYCEFYEVTHSEEFNAQLEKITEDKENLIEKPQRIPKNAIRYCHKRIKLESIMHNEFKVWNNIEPENASESEMRGYNKKINKLKAKSPCTKCKHNNKCPFRKNILPFLFTYNIDPDNSTNDELALVLSPFSGQIDENGAVIGSYYHKYFVEPFKKKITDTDKNIIRKESVYHNLKERQYKYFETIQKKSDKIDNLCEHITVSNFHLNLILRFSIERGNLSNNLTTFILLKIFRTKCGKFLQEDKFIKWITENFKFRNLTDKKIKDSIAALKCMKIIHKWKIDAFYLDTKKSFNIKILTKFKKKFPEIWEKTVNLSNGLKWYRIDIPFLMTYSMHRKIGIEQILFEYFISRNNDISRKRIRELFGISESQQRIYEKNLGLRKVWNNTLKDVIEKDNDNFITFTKKSKQIKNRYLTNEYLIDKIFDELPIQENEKFLKTIKDYNMMFNKSAIEDLKNITSGV